MKRKENLFITSDLALAAYLRLKGLKMVECDRKGSKFHFGFSDPENKAKEFSIEFVNSKERLYDDEIRTLKKILNIGS